MDTKLEKEWKTSAERRKKRRRKDLFLKILAFVLVFVLATIVLIGLDCFNKAEKMVSGEVVLTGEEWSYYASLKIKVQELEDLQVKIKIYERLLEKFSRGELKYSKRDSVIWVKSGLELKKKFNKLLRENKYNSLINLRPNFTDSKQLPTDFKPLPASFIPYVLSETEMQEAMQKPWEWAGLDSTEQNELDAH